MLTYQELDLIADAYIPILTLIFLFLLGKSMLQTGIRSQAAVAGSVFRSVIVVYALNGLDNSFNIWTLAGTNYSTHTAMALVFVVFLARRNATASLLSILSMLLYAALMVYQEYHSIGDILSTTLVVVPLVLQLQRKA
ncbi:MAG: hypothetical protein ACR2PT_02320 [Endozoicomonas sp.]